MGRVEGLNGKKFLLSVLALYAFVFFSIYFYCALANPLIVGNAIAGLPEEKNSPEIIDPALIKTFIVMAILFSLVLFVYIIPKIIHNRKIREKRRKVERYKPFNN
jgi:hypothetical protein